MFSGGGAPASARGVGGAGTVALPKMPQSQGRTGAAAAGSAAATTPRRGPSGAGVGGRSGWQQQGGGGREASAATVPFGAKKTPRFGNEARLRRGSKKKPHSVTEKGRSGVEFRARHIMCTDYSDLAEAYATLLHMYGENVPVREFARTAKEVSECETAVRGGDLGWQTIGPMNPTPGQIQSACFALSEGQMGRPFRIGGAGGGPATYHVVFLEEKRSRGK